MNQMNEKSTIPVWLNISLLIFIFISYLVEYFFTPETVQKAPYEYFFDKSPFMAIVSAVLLILVLITVGALLVQLFWNKFVADVFKTRTVTLQEAIAILLIVAILTK
jgi:hypothetical protein